MLPKKHVSQTLRDGDEVNGIIIVSNSMTNNSTYPPSTYAGLTFSPSTTLMMLCIAFTVMGIMILLGMYFYISRWIHYFSGKNQNKRVYYSWRHGKDTVDLLRSQEYVDHARTIKRNLSRTGQISEHEEYEIHSFGAPLKIFSCFMCCCLGPYESVRAHKDIFRALPGYPEFDSKSVMMQQRDTIIDI